MVTPGGCAPLPWPPQHPLPAQPISCLLPHPALPVCPGPAMARSASTPAGPAVRSPDDRGLLNERLHAAQAGRNVRQLHRVDELGSPAGSGGMGGVAHHSVAASPFRALPRNPRLAAGRSARCSHAAALQPSARPPPQVAINLKADHAAVAGHLGHGDGMVGVALQSCTVGAAGAERLSADPPRSTITQVAGPTLALARCAVAAGACRRTGAGPTAQRTVP